MEGNKQCGVRQDGRSQSNVPHWMHGELAKAVGFRTARITRIDGPSIEFEADVDLCIGAPRAVRRIVNIGA